MHKRASKYGYSNKKLKHGDDVPICPHCENYPSTIDLNLCYHTHPHPPVEGSNVFLLQTGVSMYFNFVKIVIIYLIMRLVIVDAYNILVSANGHFCRNYARLHTTELCTFYLSGFNLKSTADQGYLNVLDILNLVLTIVSIIYFLICRKITFRMQNWLDYADISQEDYSVLV